MMKIRLTREESDVCFNMTPMIDVVFLLITFFILVGTFTADEYFEVLVPDKIVNADASAPQAGSLMTITVMRKDGKICYAAGADILPGDEPALLEKMIASAIDSRTPQAGQEKTVCLRCDKQIAFENIRPVLAGIAQSDARKIQWAVTQNDSTVK
jgi:biopolymer transport protein ExbD